MKDRNKKFIRGRKSGFETIAKRKMSKSEYVRLSYSINGHVYHFDDIYVDERCYYGFCQKASNWAWLGENYVQFEGEDIVIAKIIDFEMA